LIGALVGVAAGLMISRSQRADNPGPVTSVTDPPPRPQPPPEQPEPTNPLPVVKPRVLEPAPLINQRPATRSAVVVKPAGPAGPAPVAVTAAASPPAVPEPSSTRAAVPEPSVSPLGTTALPAVAAVAPKLPAQEFPEILLVVTNDGETEELDATLVFGDTSLDIRDEDSKILRSLPYSSVGKATYSRTQRRIMFVRTIRHQLTLGAGRDQVVLRLPDATYQSILYQIEKRTGVTVAH